MNAGNRRLRAGAIAALAMAACTAKKSEGDERPAIRPPPPPASVESRLFSPSPEALLEAPAVSMLPPETSAVLVVADLRDLHRRLGLDSLEGEVIAAFRDVARRAVGRDVLDPRVLAAAGIDLHRPGAVALHDGSVIIAWPLADAEAFGQAWSDRVGVAVRGEHGLLVVPLDGGASERDLARRAAVDPSESLARTPRYRAAAQVLNFGPDAAVFVNLGSLTGPMREELSRRRSALRGRAERVRAERAASARPPDALGRRAREAQAALARAELDLRLFDRLVTPIHGAAAGVSLRSDGPIKMQLSVSLDDDRAGFGRLREGAGTAAPGVGGDRAGVLSIALSPETAIDVLGWLAEPLRLGGGAVPVPGLDSLATGDVAVSLWPRTAPRPGWGKALALRLDDAEMARTLLDTWTDAARATGLPVAPADDHVRIVADDQRWHAAVRGEHLVLATDEGALVEGALSEMAPLDHDLAERLHGARDPAGGLCIEAGLLAFLVERLVARRAEQPRAGVVGLGGSAEASSDAARRYLELGRRRAELARVAARARRTSRTELARALGTTLAFARADGDALTFYGAQFLGDGGVPDLTADLVEVWYQHSAQGSPQRELTEIERRMRRMFRALQSEDEVTAVGGLGDGHAP